MKLTVRHLFVQSTDTLDTMVEERILALEPRLEIEEARVQLEHHHDESPAFKVAVHVVTPGPDIRTEARDHTIQAAIEKAMNKLESSVTDRKLRRLRRTKTSAGRCGPDTPRLRS